MGTGGFKVIINDKIVRCHHLELDFDAMLARFDRGDKEMAIEDLSKLAVMSVVKEDSPDAEGLVMLHEAVTGIKASASDYDEE